MRRHWRSLVLVPVLALLFAGFQVTTAPTPAKAQTVNYDDCNAGYVLGVKIASIRPAGSSITRDIWMRVCKGYNTYEIWNATAIRCRVAGSLAPCDIRATVPRAKLDWYTNSGAYVATLVNQHFQASSDGSYRSDWIWEGAHVGNCPTSGGLFQANDFDIGVRLGADGIYRTVEDVEASLKGTVPCQYA